MSKEDPKHGRWILPLVIAGLVGLTYSFVNALPPAEVPLASTTTAVVTTTAPPETTTTTLPPEIEAFMALVDGYEATALEIARRINCVAPETCAAEHLCESCLKAVTFQHPDIRWIGPAPASLEDAGKSAQVREILDDLPARMQEVQMACAQASDLISERFFQPAVTVWTQEAV